MCHLFLSCSLLLLVALGMNAVSKYIPGTSYSCRFFVKLFVSSRIANILAPALDRRSSFLAREMDARPSVAQMWRTREGQNVLRGHSRRQHAVGFYYFWLRIHS